MGLFHVTVMEEAPTFEVFRFDGWPGGPEENAEYYNALQMGVQVAEWLARWPLTNAARV